jgi:hypothetical protein
MGDGEGVRMHLTELARLAREATPGPWDNRCKEFCNMARPRWIWTEYGWIAETFGNSGPADAAYIAALSPDRVLPLLEVVEEMRKALIEAEELIASEYCSHRTPCGGENCYAQNQLKALARLQAFEEGK